MFERSKHVSKTEKRCFVFKDNYFYTIFTVFLYSFYIILCYFYAVFIILLHAISRLF